MTSTTLTVVGLIFDMLGAGLLGYELFFGFPRKNKLEIAEAQLQQLRKFLAVMERMIDAYREPPYTPAEKLAEKAKLRSEYKASEDKLQSEVTGYGEGHRIKSFYFGVGGFLLLAVGFVLQLLGTIK